MFITFIRDIVVGIATRTPGYGFRVPGGVRHFSLFQKVRTGSGTHSAFCPLGTRDCPSG
jgi:hypothetical protein